MQPQTPFFPTATDSQVSSPSKPVELDAALLAFVSGAGPHGGWSAPLEGPHGGWL